MSVALLHRPAAPATVAAGGPDDLAHYWCCDANIALCGIDLTDHPVVGEDEGQDCPVCLYVLDNDVPCPVAGCELGDLP